MADPCHPLPSCATQPCVHPVICVSLFYYVPFSSFDNIPAVVWSFSGCSFPGSVFLLLCSLSVIFIVVFSVTCTVSCLFVCVSCNVIFCLLCRISDFFLCFYFVVLLYFGYYPNHSKITYFLWRFQQIVGVYTFSAPSEQVKVTIECSLLYTS